MRSRRRREGSTPSTAAICGRKARQRATASTWLPSATIVSSSTSMELSRKGSALSATQIAATALVKHSWAASYAARRSIARRPRSSSR